MRGAGVSRSGFDAWRSRRPSARANADAELMARIRDVHARSAGTDGAPHTTIREVRVRPAQDLVDRNFQAHGPDQLWVADITYGSTWSGFLYLAVGLDAVARRVGGWAMAFDL